MKMKMKLSILGAALAALTLPSVATANVSACYTPGEGLTGKFDNFLPNTFRVVTTTDKGVEVTNDHFMTGDNLPFALSYPYSGPVTLSIAHKGSAPYHTFNVPVCPSPVPPPSSSVPTTVVQPIIVPTLPKPKPKPKIKPRKPVRVVINYEFCFDRSFKPGVCIKFRHKNKPIDNVRVAG